MSTSTPRQVQTVLVSRDALVGRPVGQVVRRLHHLGLKITVRWRPTAAGSAGSVVGVLPAGQLPPGSRVTVIGAVQPGPARPIRTTASRHRRDGDGPRHHPRNRHHGDGHGKRDKHHEPHGNGDSGGGGEG